MNKRIVAKGQITIVDLSDTRSANVYLTANKPRTQIYTSGGGGSYSPEILPSSPLIITPVLYVSGGEGTENFSGTITWTITPYGVTSTDTKTWTKSSGVDSQGNRGRVVEYSGGSFNPNVHIAENCFGAFIENTGELYIAQNFTTFDAIVIEFEGVWKDNLSGKDVKVKAAITFDKRLNGGNGVLGMCYIEASSEVFLKTKNGYYPSYIDLDSILVQGQTRDNDPTDSTSFYTRWYRYNANAQTEELTRITFNKVNGQDDLASPASITLAQEYLAKGYKLIDNNTLRIVPDCIDSLESYRCQVIYTGNGDLHGKSFWSSNVATICDNTDPFQVQVTCDRGTVYVNSDFGVDDDQDGSVDNPRPVMEATVTKDGVQIGEVDRSNTDSIKATKHLPYIVSYDWAKYKIGGDVKTFADGSTITGDKGFERDSRSRKKKFQITQDDVTIKATFFVEASIYVNPYLELDETTFANKVPVYGGENDILIEQYNKHKYMLTDAELADLND